MNPQVIAVDVLDDYKLRITFSSDEVRIFDVTPYLHYSAFKRLKIKAILCWQSLGTAQFVGLVILIFAQIRFI